jgi:hypothetical protein
LFLKVLLRICVFVFQRKKSQPRGGGVDGSGGGVNGSGGGVDNGGRRPMSASCELASVVGCR